VTAFTTDLYREFPMQRLDASVARRETSDGVRILRLPAWSLPGELHYPFFRGLGRALRAESPELLHVHTYGTNHAAVATRYSRRTGVPIVLSAHFHPSWSIEGGWLRHRIRGFYDRVLAAPVVSEARCLVVESHEEERLIRENGFPLPRVAVIPPGYTPLPAPAPGERPFARSVGVDGPFVLFVGRLASNKGLIPLVEAFQGLAKADPSASLVLVGPDGGQRSTIEARVPELGLGGRVRIPGFVSDEALLAAAFREARVVALPSEYEAFGLVLLEALAQGTPVVASRVGGIPEFIEDGKAGRLVPPLNVPALEEAIAELWNDPTARSRMGEYGRTQVVPRYSWERVVDRLSEVYTDVLAR